MRKIAVAEQLLALAMPRARAASTVGDLLEGSRGTAGFWVAVGRTLLGFAFGQISPVTVVKAWAFTILMIGLLRAGFLVLLLTVERIVPETVQVELWLGGLFLLSMPVLVGRLVALWMPGRELGVWLTNTALTALAVALVWWTGPASITHWINGFVLPPLSLLPLMVGVLLGRHANLHRGTPA